VEQADRSDEELLVASTRRPEWLVAFYDRTAPGLLAYFVRRTLGAPRAVTVSIGVALLTPEMYDASVLVRAADTALYEAKHSGKNTVVVAG